MHSLEKQTISSQNNDLNLNIHKASDSTTLVNASSKVRFELTYLNQTSTSKFKKETEEEQKVYNQTASCFPKIKSDKEKLHEAMHMTISNFKSNVINRQKSQQSTYINSDSNPILGTESSFSTLTSNDPKVKQRKNSLYTDFTVVKTLENAKRFKEVLLKSNVKAQKAPLIYNNIIGLSYTKYYTQNK